MKRNTIFKLLLDVAMLVLYLLLMFAQSLDGFFHEAAGLAVGAAFVLHVCLNIPMTKGLLSSIRHGKAGAGKKLLLSDVVLTLCMPVVLATGVLIAKDLFVLPAVLPWSLVFMLHNVLSYVCLAVMACHLLLHMKYLAAVLGKLPSARPRELGAALGWFMSGAVAVAALFVGLSLYGKLFPEIVTANPAKSSSFAAAPVSEEKPSPEPTAKAPAETPAPAPTATPVPEQEPPAPSSSEPQEESPAEEPEEEPMEYEPEPVPEAPTLEEYLSELYCSGCGRGCSLLNPRCGKGTEQAAQAEAEYYQLYGE